MSYHGDRGHPYPSAEDSLLLGSCTGLLSCAAVSSCRNVGELLPLAVEVVAMAIHLGLCVMTVRDLVDSSSSSTGSWSVLVSDLNEEDAINRIAQFHEKRVSTISAAPQKIIALTNRESTPRLDHISAQLAPRVSPSAHHRKSWMSSSKKRFQRNASTSKLPESTVLTTHLICTMSERSRACSTPVPI